MKPPARVLFGLLFVLSGLTGCQSMMTNTTVTESAAASNENVVVQVRPAGRKARNLTIDLQPNLRLQDVVNASKVNFRNRSVYIVRTSPTTGQQHKLQASFGSNRRISMETDYAIQPGDRVVIAQDTTSSFDRVMKSVMGRS